MTYIPDAHPGVGADGNLERMIIAMSVPSSTYLTR